MFYVLYIGGCCFQKEEWRYVIDWGRFEIKGLMRIFIRKEKKLGWTRNVT